MLSVIICSIDPLRLEKLESNIMHTAGVECEITGVDNRTDRRPIAEVYNSAASRARFPFLLFIHEDVSFMTREWAAPIIAKLRETDCGVIGFAGGRIKTRAYSGWCTWRPEYDRTWYHFPDAQGHDRLSSSGADGRPGFAPTVTVDGFAMFVRKDIWEHHPFDDRMLRGFHCYDLDFSLELASSGYRNYVCQQTVDVMHCSEGSFGEAWLEETIRMHESKWRKFLPLMAPDLTLDGKALQSEEELSAYKFLKQALALKSRHSAKIFRQFCRMPLDWPHLGHVISTSAALARVMLSSKGAPRDERNR